MSVVHVSTAYSCVAPSTYRTRRGVGKCKSWTVDRGLDHGLDRGLDCGLDYGLLNGRKLDTICACAQSIHWRT